MQNVKTLMTVVQRNLWLTWKHPLDQIVALSSKKSITSMCLSSSLQINLCTHFNGFKFEGQCLLYIKKRKCTDQSNPILGESELLPTTSRLSDKSLVHNANSIGVRWFFHIPIKQIIFMDSVLPYIFSLDLHGCQRAHGKVLKITSRGQRPS